MKTFQRILAVVLALVMSLSVIGVAAFATTVETTATIDTTKTGSITIHKYEFNGDNSADTYKGTGSANDPVPADAIALDGVTFKITKVAELTEYYGTNGKALPTVDEAQAIVAANDAKDDNDSTKLFTTTGVTASTDDTKGQVTFSNLSLGLYLVQETNAPAQITGKTPDFLVSIPMTTTDGADWLYDVHVFPKNSSTYAGVTLLKQGKVGNAEASALSGATFVLQVKDSNGEWTTVTEDNKRNPINGETKEAVEAGKDGTTLTTGADGKISVSDLAPGEYRFVETSVGNGYIMDGVTTYNFEIADGTEKVTVNGEEQTVTAGSVIIGGSVVDTTANPITVINEKPDMKKEIDNDSTEANGTDEDNAGVGDTVKYKVTIDVPSNITSLKTFTLTDTPTNLNVTNSTIAIKYIDASGVEQTLGSSAYSVSEDDKDATIVNGFTITFKPSQMSAVAGKQIVVTYDAVVLAGAATAGKAPNTATLTYSNKIHSNEADGEGDTDSIKDSAVVYTYKIDITKYKDSNAEGNELDGVEFELYRVSVAEANKVSVVKDRDGNYHVAGAGESGTTTLTTGNGGKLVVTGLDDSDYYLVETKTEAGYNLLKEPVKLERSVYSVTKWTTSDTFVNGVLVKKEYESHIFVTNTNEGEKDSSNVVSQTIINKKGFDLPQTGGIGTLMFILMGGVLMAGGICLIAVPNKKRSV